MFEVLYAQAAHGPVSTGYLQAWLAGGRPRTNATKSDWGAIYRLIENHVNRGRYEEALPLVRRMDEHLAAIGLEGAELLNWRFDSLVDYSRRAPCFLGHYKYYRGMLALNQGNHWEMAAACFRVAAHLRAMEEQLPGGVFVGNMSLLAKLHEGIALSRGGRARCRGARL